MLDDVAAPFGSFMEAMPHSAFIVIHSVLIIVGYWLSRKTKNSGFLLFVLAWDPLESTCRHASLSIL